MELDQEQARFSGWAIVDVLGHQRYVGFVRTEAYGAAVLFRVDVPELFERESVLDRPQYVGGKYCPVGSKVKREATPGYTKFIGAGSIYTITPCTEAAAMKAVEANQTAELKLVELPPDGNLLTLAKAAEYDDEDYDIEAAGATR